MTGDFGAPKNAKWEAQGVQKVIQNGLTPIDPEQVKASRGQVEGKPALVGIQGSPETLFSHDL